MRKFKDSRFEKCKLVGQAFPLPSNLLKILRLNRFRHKNSGGKRFLHMVRAIPHILFGFTFPSVYIFHDFR